MVPLAEINTAGVIMAVKTSTDDESPSINEMDYSASRLQSNWRFWFGVSPSGGTDWETPPQGGTVNDPEQSGSRLRYSQLAL
jgi:hypothetical protein